jgi:hypothetical protein
MGNNKKTNKDALRQRKKPEAPVPDDTVDDNDSDDKIPDDVRAVKDKLEAETGKTYRYRPAKKDLPSISDMLVHGSPESQGRPRTWTETIGYPVALAAIFLISLLIFHHAPHSQSKRNKFVLPKMQKRPPGNAATAAQTSSRTDNEKHPLPSKD